MAKENTGKRTSGVQIVATLHDTYHDNGMEQCEKVLKPGESESFVLKAPSRKWIRHIAITSDMGSKGLKTEPFAFAMEPRSGLNPLNR
jgi:hypothetical protein